MASFQTERMRALRRDSYRCQYRSPSGRPCLRPTGHVVYTDPDGAAHADNLIAFCRTGH